MVATINNRVQWMGTQRRIIYLISWKVNIFLFSKVFLLFLLAKLPLVKLIKFFSCCNIIFFLSYYILNSPSFFVQIPARTHIHTKNSNTKHKSQSFDQSKPCNYGIKTLFSRKAIRRKRKEHGVFQTWV